MTVPAGELLAEATQRLAAAGVDSPRVDAELLLAATIDTPRSRVATLERVPRSAADTFTGYVDRRVAREPLQHITGTAPFRTIEVAVGPGVFVPRPETELLVDAVLALLRTLEAPAVVDLCAGSGALALAVATEVPGARVIAVENAAGATRWLRENTAGTRVRPVTGDVLDPEVLRPLYGQADAVLCNPPYVPLPTDVAPEVLADPAEAVFAGPDGLAVMPAVIARAALLLKPGGRFALEHDDTHGTLVPGLLADDGRFTDIADHDDLTGRPRYATATRV